MISEDEWQSLDAELHELAAAAGVDRSDANGGIEEIRLLMQQAQQLFMLHLERANDVGLQPWMAMLAMYELARLQVRENMKRGTISRGHLRLVRMGAELAKNQHARTAPLQFDETGAIKRPTP